MGVFREILESRSSSCYSYTEYVKHETGTDKASDYGKSYLLLASSPKVFFWQITLKQARILRDLDS